MIMRNRMAVYVPRYAIWRGGSTLKVGNHSYSVQYLLGFMTLINVDDIPGNTGAAKALLDAYTTAIAGTTQDGMVGEARLHSGLVEAMENDEYNSSKKLFHLAAGVQQGLVSMDAMVVSEVA